MERVLADLGPPARGGTLALLAPDEHFAVIRARGEDLAELGVCPGDLPDGAGVAACRRITKEIRTQGGRCEVGNEPSAMMCMN